MKHEFLCCCFLRIEVLTTWSNTKAGAPQATNHGDLRFNLNSEVLVLFRWGDFVAIRRNYQSWQHKANDLPSSCCVGILGMVGKIVVTELPRFPCLVSTTSPVFRLQLHFLAHLQHTQITLVRSIFWNFGTFAILRPLASLSLESWKLHWNTHSPLHNYLLIRSVPKG